MIKHLLWVTCVCLAAACGGGGGGISPGDLADEIEGAQCDFLVKCEGTADRATCDASVSVSGTEFNNLLEAIDRGTIKYDSGAAKECADFIGGGSCEFGGFHTDNPCDDIFEGTVAVGGACFVSLECAGNGECDQNDQTCDPDVACCPGTCVAGPTESAIGGPCDDDLHFCAFNSFCKTTDTGAPGTCTALIPNEGAACTDIDACANPMYCNINFTTGSGTCKKAPSSGATCNRTTDLLPCADSRDYCDPATSKCVRNAAVSAACGNGISCVDYASCVNSVCVADPKAGENCVVDGQDCTGSLECVNGKCSLPPVGISCPL